MVTYFLAFVLHLLPTPAAQFPDNCTIEVTLNVEIARCGGKLRSVFDRTSDTEVIWDNEGNPVMYVRGREVR